MHNSHHGTLGGAEGRTGHYGASGAVQHGSKFWNVWLCAWKDLESLAVRMDQETCKVAVRMESLAFIGCQIVSLVAAVAVSTIRHVDECLDQRFDTNQTAALLQQGMDRCLLQP